MSTLVYTKVLTLGDNETYWGGHEKIQGLCQDFKPTYIPFDGKHCWEEWYPWVVDEAMDNLLGDV